MTIKAPSTDQIVEVGAELGMRLSEDEAAQYLAAMTPLLAGYDTVDAMADELPPVTYPRVPGRAPADGENPHNAWYWTCEIKGAADGKLAGKRVAIKDNHLRRRRADDERRLRCWKATCPTWTPPS